MTPTTPGSYSLITPSSALAEKFAHEATLEEDQSTETSSGSTEGAKSEERKPEEKKPEEAPKTWEERLKEAKITPEQAFEILDAILAQGYYERTFELFQGRYPVVLRTRSSESRAEIARYVDLEPVVGARTAYERRLKAVLIFSLVRVGKVALPWPQEKATAEVAQKLVEERETVINRIPAAMLEEIYKVLVLFETATFAALSGGAPEGF